MATDTLPGHDQQPEGVTCGSCGRFVGPLSKCPHCGARVSKRLSVHLTRYAAVILATVGLGLLYLYSVNKEIPVIRIGDIKETMNFAFVTIEGSVVSEPRVFKQAGRVRSIRFDLDDGSGEIPVTAYSAQAQALVEAGKVPRIGDTARVSGSLSVSADNNILMRLQSPTMITLSAPELSATAIADINQDITEPSVLIQGVISAVRPPPSGSKAPWTIVVKDATGEIPVAFWQDIYAEIEEPQLLQEGAAVNVRAGIGSYKGNLQLRMAGGKDIEFTGKASIQNMVAGPGAPVAAAPSAPAYAPTTPSDPDSVKLETVTADQKGKRVLTEGIVREVHDAPAGSKAPSRVIIEDEGTYRMIVYWEKVAQQLTDNKPEVGQRIQVRGDVDVYRDEVQLEVSFPDQIKILSGATAAPAVLAAPAPANPGPASYQPAARPQAESIMLDEVTADRKGSRIVTEGVVREVSDPPAGSKAPTRIVIEDGGSTLTVVYWEKVAQQIGRNKPQAGQRIQVRGDVDVYNNAVQLKVSFPDQIKILAQASAAPAVTPEQMDVDYSGGPADLGEPMPAGQVTTAMEGQTVTVQGVLGEPESLRSGVVYPLTDASGATKVVLWDRFISGTFRDALGAGVTVKVRGPVKPYQGIAQIVPENEQAISVIPGTAE